MDEPSVFGFFFFVPDFLFFWPTPGSVFTKPPHGRQLARRVWRAPRGGAHPAAKQRRTDCHRQFNNRTSCSLCECRSFHHTLGIDKDQAARCDCERQNQQVPPREGHGGRRKARNSESMKNSPYASRISIRVVPQENQIASVKPDRLWYMMARTSGLEATTTLPAFFHHSSLSLPLSKSPSEARTHT